MASPPLLRTLAVYDPIARPLTIDEDQNDSRTTQHPLQIPSSANTTLRGDHAQRRESETPQSLNYISDYTPVSDRQSPSRPSYFSHHLKAPLQHPLPVRPKSAISNSSTIQNTTFSEPECLPARGRDSPLRNLQQGETIHQLDYPSVTSEENLPAMSSIDRIVTQIDSLLRGSDLNKPTQFLPLSAHVGHQDYHSPLVSEQTRGQDVVSCLA